MKKKTALFWLISILPFLSFSQTSISTSKPYLTVDGGTKTFFSKGNTTLLLERNGGIIIQKFRTDNLELIQTKVYEDFGTNFGIEHIFEINQKYIVLYNTLDNGVLNLLYREVDFESGSFKTPGVPIFSFNSSEKYCDGFKISFSNDKSKILCQYQILNSDKSLGKNFLFVLNSDFTLLWKNEIALPIAAEKLKNVVYKVDSEGSVFALAKIQNDAAPKLKKKDEDVFSYRFELFKYTAGASSHTAQTLINLESKFVTHILLEESKDMQMVCAGFFNLENNSISNNATGIVVLKINSLCKIVQSSTYEIPFEVINQYESASVRRKKVKQKESRGSADMDNLEIRSLLINDDGSILVIGEQHFIDETTRKNRPYGNANNSITVESTTYTDFYNHILVTKIGNDLKLQWMQKLAKQQEGRAYSGGGGYQGGMSFKYWNLNQHDYFAYLDKKDNLNLTNDKVPDTFKDEKGGILTLYKLNNINGNKQQYSLVDLDDVNGMNIYQFDTDRVSPINDNQILLEGYKKKKEDILIKLTLNN